MKTKYRGGPVKTISMNTETKLPVENLESLTLDKGSHDDRSGAVCVMEAVAWVAGEPHSDKPECACPVITRFLVSWNDALPTDDDRDRLLKPLVPSIVNTKSTPDVEAKRSRLAYDWFIGVYTPAWLDLAGLKGEAQALRDNPSLETCIAARDKAAAAGAAAGNAAWNAAWAAAWAAAGAAAGNAAWAAAGNAAAGDAAGDAAATAAGNAAAAGAAAGDALLPTVKALQESAIDLVKAMIAAAKEA